MSDSKHAADVSLLWPSAPAPVPDLPADRWGERTAADLDIDAIAGYLSADRAHAGAVRAILMALCTDRDTILFRQAVLDDLLRAPALAAGLEGLVPALAELARLSGPAAMHRTLLHQTVWRLGELDLFVDTVERLRGLFGAEDARPQAEAFERLRAHLDAVAADPSFQDLVAVLPDLRASLHNLASVTIGVNLDDELRPVEATLLSINAKAFRGREISLLHRLLSRADDDYRGIAPLHGVPARQAASSGPMSAGAAGGIPPAERENPLLVPLLRDLDAILKEVVQPVARGLSRFIHVRTRFLAALEPELVFYLGAIRLIRALQAAGLPASQPEIVPMAEHACTAAGLYNLSLALRRRADRQAADLAAEIVLNDTYFNAAERVFILTGPNRGGKTTYVQAVGLLQVLAQAGLWVPARAARVSPVDGLFSHFPAEDRLQFDLGRLGEETRRLAAIFRHATPDSLVLLNESLSATSPGESLVLAGDVVRALRLLGARTLFATHLHELAAGLERLNAEPPPGVRVASLVAGVRVPGEGDDASDGATRTYRIEPGPPPGDSYARDIARRHGISYDQLARTLAERGVVAPPPASPPEASTAPAAESPKD